MNEQLEQVSDFINQIISMKRDEDIGSKWMRHIDLASNDLAMQLFGFCLVSGNAEILEYVWKSRGEFRIELQLGAEGSDFSRTGLIKYSSEIGSGYFEIDHCKKSFLAEMRTANDAVKYFRTVIGAGAVQFLGDVSKDNAFSYMRKDILEPGKLSKKCRVQSSLPCLSNGHVSQTALLSCLERQGVGLPGGWFEDVLCWADAEAVQMAGGNLHPFESVREITLSTRPATEYGEPVIQKKDIGILRSKVFSSIDLAKTVGGMSDAEVGSIYNRYLYSDVYNSRLDSISIGLRPVGRSTNITDSNCLNSYASEEIRAGYGAPQGMILCRTTHEFLSRFSKDSPLPEGEKEWNDHLLSTFPLWKVIGQSRGVALDCDEPQHVAYRPQVIPPNVLAMAIHNLKCKEDVIRDVGLGFYQRVFEFAHENGADAKDVQVMRDFFHLDCSSLTVNIEYVEVKNERVDGCTFQPGTSFNISGPKNMDGRAFSYGCQEIMEMTQGVATVNGESTAVTLKEAIQGMRKRIPPVRREIFVAVIKSAGLEACLPLLTTESLWDGIMLAYDASELRKYASILPRRVKVKISGSILNI